MSLIEIDDVRKVYRMGDVDVLALSGVSLKIEEGEFVAVMGSSGSGKSTLMSILGGLDRPTSGSYCIDGTDISDLPPRALARTRNEKIGFVFQQFHLLARTSALENAELPLLYAHGIPGRERHARAREALRSVGLADREHHHPNQLSGGQQQRVAIGRALVNRPSVLLADEPTGNLDSKVTAEIMELLVALNDAGVTIIFVTHEPDVAQYAKRKIVLKDGEIVSDAPVGNRTRPAPRAAPAADAAAGGAEPPRLTPAAGEPRLGIPAVSGMTLRIAIRALGRNKVRSALTMLGVIIGVAAVIAMVAIGAGATESVNKQMATMGQNQLMVMPGSTSSGAVAFGSGSVQTLTPRDAASIKRDCPSATAVAIVVRTRAQVVWGASNWAPNSVQGCNPDYLAVREWPVSEGEAFTDNDVSLAAQVCLVGQTVADNLFGNESPVGQKVRLKNLPFRVVGVLEKKGSNTWQDQDDVVLLPWTTVKKKLQGSSFNNVDQLLVGAETAGALVPLEQELRTVLRANHKLDREGAAPAMDDFQVRNMAEFLSASAQMTKIMTGLLAAIASVSLLVGGIGIMNIMLVSVTERTREIGLRMAVGASGGNILAQFLAESIVLSGIGGLLGIALGVGGARTVATYNNWPVIVSPDVIVLAVAFSAAVGILFGFYPALRASRLDPIDALRYE